MVMRQQRVPRLKPLLEQVPPGFMVDARWLKSQGIDPKSIHNYVAQGWLERVVRGVYRRPLPRNVRASDQAGWQPPLLSLQWILGWDVHLGGESALQLQGFAHFLPLGKPVNVNLYGDVPSWLHRLPTQATFVVHRRTLFGDDRTGIQDINDAGDESPATAPAVNVWRWPVRAASPERAILEALDELPGGARFDHLDTIFQGLTTLRPRLVQKLLEACRSVKVRRLFLVFADRHDHAWRKYLDTGRIDLGAGPRALVAGGRLHPRYKIYVPADFVPDHEGTGGGDG